MKRSTTDERAQVFQRVLKGELTVTAAASELRMSRRHTHRLLAAFRSHGVEALVSRRVGRPSNRAYSHEQKQAALAIIATVYPGSNPTLATKKLTEHLGFSVCYETVRTWMLEAKIWKPRGERENKRNFCSWKNDSEPIFTCTRCGGKIVFRTIKGRGPVPIHLSGPASDQPNETCDISK